jgi:chromosomal replication initiator protein
MPAPTPIGQLPAQFRADPFVVLPENQLAHAAAFRLVETAAGAPQQLTCLYGPSGVGKTHLAQHVLVAALRQRRSAKCLFISARELAVYLADVTAQTTLLDFYAEASRWEILVCEDLEELRLHDRLQQLWLGLIEHLLNGSTRVLVTCTRNTDEPWGLSARIVNRCHGGFCTALRPLGVPSKELILEQFAQSMQLVLPPDVRGKLAERGSGLPGELRQTLTRLDEFARKNKSLLTSELVERSLPQQLPRNGPTLEQVVTLVAAEFELTVEELKSASRQAHLVLPRQCAMLLARQLTGLPLEAIGRFLGNRSHTTVSHGCSRLEELLPTAPKLRKQMARLRQRLPGKKEAG